MARRFITLFLIVIMVVDLCGIETKASGNTETGEIDFDKCVLFAQQDVDSIVINAGNLSINGDIVSGGNNIINARGKNINGQIFDNQEIAMLRLLPNIERQYLENSDYFDGDYISETFNENVNKSRFVSGSFICENFLAINNSALVAGGNITVTNQVTNMNNAILCSVIGDIFITSDCLSVDGIIYAPLGSVHISGQNINISGNVIAQNIIIEGKCNVNINKKNGFINNLLVEVPSAVKYGFEDSDEIDIGEIYFKDYEAEDDIVYAGDGLYCVKNQFLLSVQEDIPFSVVNEF